MKKTLSKSFIQKTEKTLENERTKELIGEENFPKFETIIKAIVGVNDREFLGQIITALIMGLTIDLSEELVSILANPTYKDIVVRNTLEVFSE